MVFWRKKKNAAEQEREAQADRMLHRKSDPAIEPPTEYEAEIDHDLKERLHKTEASLISELDEQPAPDHTLDGDAKEAQELSDHTEEGGWLSRLTGGLSKSTNKITQGLTDLLTKKKLDQDTLDELEDSLITADLGPKTAAKVIEAFSKDRFGKDISEEEIRVALADTMGEILKTVAHPLIIEKPDNGPFVILVCGVNGAGKTTTIGKLAHQYHFRDGLKVMIAAGDTFRAAAVEQLQEWSKRSGATFISKDVGADSASVAYESYVEAVEQGVDVLMIDTAGRLHNKKNLMAELEKIIRVLQKQSSSVPHATILVLDSTTGQNAFSQVETFGDMIDLTGLVVTKLDGSAKGGVLVGLADQFSVPVHAVGVGEGIKDLQSFHPVEYARSLMGLS